MFRAPAFMNATGSFPSRTPACLHSLLPPCLYGCPHRGRDPLPRCLRFLRSLPPRVPVRLEAATGGCPRPSGRDRPLPAPALPFNPSGWTPCRPQLRGQGPHRCPGCPNHCRQSPVRSCPASLSRQLRGGVAAPSRGRVPRQGEHARDRPRRHRHQPPHGPRPQPLGRGLHHGRLLVRLCGCRGARPRAVCPRHRHGYNSSNLLRSF